MARTQREAAQADEVAKVPQTCRVASWATVDLEFLQLCEVPKVGKWQDAKATAMHDEATQVAKSANSGKVYGPDAALPKLKLFKGVCNIDE
mmetsp:Transcript_4606/g.14930  ORF Transcript_4606/g.14930 Transcript_4606/m.14930 type:complete len:91 (-) Transcript_4606:228-500(-)